MSIMKLAKLAAAAAFILVPIAAQAGPRDDLADGMAKCVAIADNAARLTCYDALGPTVHAAVAAPPAAAPPMAVASAPPAATPPAATPPVPPPAQTADNSAWYDPFHVFGTAPRQQVRPEQFGAENLAPPPPPPGQPANAPAEPVALDSITSTVATYSFTPFGKFLVILDNGQIWQQAQNDVTPAHFSRSSKNTVTIKRGMMGGYNMLVNDSSATFKVTRLK
ncbi:MAG TPA: hypothetical protein VHZ78_00730 [Rhizomicrobium sp.]|nr:hypothetical protein [Rhizomicrobium sp.]